MTTDTRSPTSDVSFTGTWSGSAGTRYQAVDDHPDSGNPINDGLTHGTTAGEGLMGFSAFSVPAGATAISVQVIYYDFKNGSQACNIRARILCNDTTGLDAPGGTHNPGNGNANIALRTDDYGANNPKTGVAWTVNDVNGVGANALTAFGVVSTDANPSITISSIIVQVTYTASQTYDKAGGKQSPAVLAGADSIAFGESSETQSPSVLSGADANAFNETTDAQSPSVLSGEDASIFGETGATIASSILSAEDANVFNESGVMASPGVLSGSGTSAMTFDKTGTWQSPAVLSSADANVFNETVVTAASGVLTGEDANIFSETVVTISPSVLVGASVYEPGAGIFTKTGVMASAASLSGSDSVIFTDTGAWFAPSTIAGTAVVSEESAGGVSGAAAWFVFGAENWDTSVRVTHGEPQRSLLEPLDLSHVLAEDEEMIEILMLL